MNMTLWMWAVAGVIIVIGLIIIWSKAFKKTNTEVKMKAESDLWADVKAEFHTLVLTLFYKAKSATFWIAVILIVVGLQKGGIEGMLMAVLSALGYTSKEAFQNVKFGQMKADKELLNSPIASTIAEKALLPNYPSDSLDVPEKQQVLQPDKVVWSEPFDVEWFARHVLEQAKNWIEINDITRYFAAESWGGTYAYSQLSDFQKQGYKDELTKYALKAFEYKFDYPFDEAEKHLKDDKSCPYYSVENMARQKGHDYWAIYYKVKGLLES